jgi:hypothetical protein
MRKIIEHPGSRWIEQTLLELGVPPKRVRVSNGGALRFRYSSSAGSMHCLPLESRNRCGRCGAALDRDLFCAACRTFFAKLSADTARRPAR